MGIGTLGKVSWTVAGILPVGQEPTAPRISPRHVLSQRASYKTVLEIRTNHRDHFYKPTAFPSSRKTEVPSVKSTGGDAD